MTTQSGVGSVSPPISAASQTVYASDTGSLAECENPRPNNDILQDSLATLRIEDVEDVKRRLEAFNLSNIASAASKPSNSSHTAHPLARYRVSEGDGQAFDAFKSAGDASAGRMRFWEIQYLASLQEYERGLASTQGPRDPLQDQPKNGAGRLKEGCEQGSYGESAGDKSDQVTTGSVY